jgi:hypothetical protein
MQTNSILLFCILLFSSKLYATQWYTQQNGFWNQGSTWLGGIAPDNFPNDTINIQHAVALTQNLYLGSDCFLKIESNGSICGHNNMLVPSGATLLKYGLLELDTLYIPGGSVTCNPPGNVILTVYGLLSNGGSLSITCNFQVGPWFECQLPEFGFLSLNEIDKKDLGFDLYPNPSNEFFILKAVEQATKVQQIQLLDLAGKIMLSVENYNPNDRICIKELPPSLYFLRIKSEDNYYFKKIIHQ